MADFYSSGGEKKEKYDWPKTVALSSNRGEAEVNYIVNNPDFVLFTIDNVLPEKDMRGLQQAMARSRSLQ
jgi:hypothetical protein